MIDDLTELACERCADDTQLTRSDGHVVCVTCLTPDEFAKMYPPKGDQ